MIESVTAMSIENHPNFHAVRFAALVTEALYTSLRGDGANVPVDVRARIIGFVEDVENAIDSAVAVYKHENR